MILLQYSQNMQHLMYLYVLTHTYKQDNCLYRLSKDNSTSQIQVSQRNGASAYD